MLDIAPGATGQEIEEAYKRARAAYSEDSVAVYSLYSTEERETMLKDITDAYEALKDPLKKRVYDKEVLGQVHEDTSEVDITSLVYGNGKEISKETPETGRPDHVSRFKQNLIVMNGADPMIAEQYRILFAAMEQINLKNSYKTIAITSAVKGEGKSITSLNLAYIMANEFKKKTLLVECDLRKPSTVTNLLDKSEELGLAEALRGEIDVHAAIRRIENTSLYILPVGTNVRKTSELISSPRLKTLLNALKTEFDYVIVDCPPILPMVDMNIISRVVDAIMVVVMAGVTPKDLVVKAVNSITSGNVVGIVLNKAETKLSKYYY